MFICPARTAAPGRIGRVLIGLGLITLALQLIVERHEAAHRERRQCEPYWWPCPTRCCSTSWWAPILSVLSYSSLAIVLLTATLASSQGMIPVARWRWVWCWVRTWAAGCWRSSPPAVTSPQVRRLPLGNLIFKLMRRGGPGRAACWAQVHQLLQQTVRCAGTNRWWWFHLGFNLRAWRCCSSASPVVVGPAGRPLAAHAEPTALRADSTRPQPS